jgi:2,3,4,5-tetrahydropyridine-2-carboxylate N-succinyltransferase
MTQQLQHILDTAWENRATSPPSPPRRKCVMPSSTSSPTSTPAACAWPPASGVGQWTTHQWIKKAVLLSFRLKDNAVMRAGDLGFYDKVQTKFSQL